MNLKRLLLGLLLACGVAQVVHITLVEADGTAWSTALTLAAGWSETTVSLQELRIAQGVKLPLGYPERWNYWSPPAQGRGGISDRLNPNVVEHVQISLRPEVTPSSPVESERLR